MRIDEVRNDSTAIHSRVTRLEKFRDEMPSHLQIPD